MNKIVITEATIDISELQKDKYVALLTDYKLAQFIDLQDSGYQTLKGEGKGQ